MSDKINLLLDRAMADSQLHARLLNTLSLLEHIGLRKIIKSQASATATLETLSHAAEEARHAVLLKKLALDMGGESFATYSPTELLAGQAARNYFKQVDEMVAAVAKRLNQAAPEVAFVYAVVTWLVEIRAIEFYEAYVTKAEALGRPTFFRALLKEEGNHLKEMKHKISGFNWVSAQELERILSLETKLFAALLEELLNAASGEIPGEGSA